MNAERVKFIHVENSMFNIATDICFRASMRQLLLPDHEIMNGLGRLLDELKGTESKREREYGNNHNEKD